jgi:hypothetical protein
VHEKLSATVVVVVVVVPVVVPSQLLQSFQKVGQVAFISEN